MAGKTARAEAREGAGRKAMEKGIGTAAGKKAGVQKKAEGKEGVAVAGAAALEKTGKKAREEKLFEIAGTFREKNREKKFTRAVSAVNEGFAREKLMCLFGSEHKTKRRHIKIESVNVVGG